MNRKKRNNGTVNDDSCIANKKQNKFYSFIIDTMLNTMLKRKKHLPLLLYVLVHIGVQFKL